MNGREDEYQWAGPYLYSRQVIAVRTDSKIRNISDLAGKRVAVQATTKPEEVLLERSDPRVPEVDMVYSLSGMDEIYASLRKGYVDAITGHESALERFVGNAPDMYAILMKVCIFQNWELLSKMTLIRIWQKNDTDFKRDAG